MGIILALSPSAAVWSKQVDTLKLLEVSDIVGLMAHMCNPSVWKVETGGARVQGQPPLHSDFKTN